MSQYLVIVESPAKAKTIKKYLGKEYTVKASVGHVKDLPKSKLGVDVEHDFAPEYQVIRGKGKVLQEIKKAAKSASKVFLAPDPDREGEAIAWHIAQELKGKKGAAGPEVVRVLFNEITKRAVQEAVQHPLQLDESKYNSQQARRILDRLVGYQISPLLWRKVRRGLSAGRVQSVAVRLVVEREREIDAFVPEEYWTIDALLAGAHPPAFTARLAKIDGKKAKVAGEAEATQIVAELEKADFQVTKVERKERRRKAPAPFITSPAPAGGHQPPPVHRQEDHDPGPAPLRGRGARGRGQRRAHHLHAYRLHAALRRGGHQGPRVHRHRPSAPSRSPRSPTSTRAASRPRTPTRRSGPPRWSTRPRR